MSLFTPLFLDDEARVRLLPVFLADLGTYLAELRRDGDLTAVHGAAEWFATPDALTRTVDRFLSANGVRPLTEAERCELHAGLIRAKGDAGYAVLIRQTRQS